MRNDVIANYHRIRQDILPPEKNTLIFSERERLFTNFTKTYPKSDIILKKKILKELKYFFRDRKTLIYALNNSRILHLLLSEILNKNEKITILSIKSLEMATREKLGKKLLIKNNGISSLIILNEKKNKKIIYELLRIFYNLSKEEDLIKILLENKIFELIIKNLQNETKNSFLVLLNKILTNFLRYKGITEIALDYNLENILIENCFNTSFGVLNQSVYNLLLISYNDKGKKIITDKFIYKKIWDLFVKFFEDKENFISCKKDCFSDFSLNGSFCEFFDEEENLGFKDNFFFNLFSSTSQIVEAKIFYQKKKAHKFIFKYIKNITIKNINNDVLLSCILFLTNLAENHIVRKDLLNELEFFKNLKKTFLETDLEIFISDLIEVIEWKP